MSRVSLGWRARLISALGLALLVALAFSGSPVQAATVHLSTDPFTQATCAASATTNHHTEVEPDTFSFGSTIVAAFQVGRIFDGGACAIGFATSSNNGSSWTNGLLPGITKYVGSGPYARATDPAVAYDAAHGAWLISTLGLTETGGVKGGLHPIHRTTGSSQLSNRLPLSGFKFSRRQIA